MSSSPISRRDLLRSSALSLGGLLTAPAVARLASGDRDDPFAPRVPHFRPRAKRVIFLHMAGGPSQLDLFDHKPELARRDGQPTPRSLMEDKRFAFVNGDPVLFGSPWRFARHGASGAWVSELLPQFARVVDRVAFVKSMHTTEFNHAPAQLLMHSGSPRYGRPSMGSWVSWGLGTENRDLPAFAVLVSGGKVPSAGQSVWGSGFLPSVYQGVELRSQGDPVLYLSDPPGMSRAGRRRSLDALADLNALAHERTQDPQTLTRMAQYELAYRMQASVPEVMDLRREPRAAHELYGTADAGPSFANNCLLARRLLEAGTRFVQLYHWGWDHHGSREDQSLPLELPRRAREIDRPMTALLVDLAERGLLEDTLVVWGGEFGRTPMRENRKDQTHLGRDHHPDAFTVWLAGAGVRAGITLGETDELGAAPVQDPVSVFDLQATILHLLGFDHEHMTVPFQGRDFRLTDVHGRVVRELLA